jgi:hypothetical protein
MPIFLEEDWISFDYDFRPLIHGNRFIEILMDKALQDYHIIITKTKKCHHDI